MALEKPSSWLFSVCVVMIELKISPRRYENLLIELSLDAGGYILGQF